MSQNNPPFGFLRACFWPIYSHELKKAIPMLIMAFLLAFNYNMLHPLKDTIVVTAKGSGAEVIVFIKTWAMFPMSLLFAWLFVRLSNRMSREHVFYCILGFFLTFFLIFAFVLYPNKELLHGSSCADWLSRTLPSGCKGFVAMVHHWSFTIFYVMADLWSNIILALLFWGFVNQVTKVDEAKRFYGLIGVAINISGIIAGQFSIFVTNYNAKNCLNTDPWGSALVWLMATVICAGLGAMLALRCLSKNLQKHPDLASNTVAQKKEPKQKMSMRENTKYLFSSSYILYIALIIITYNVVINLVEVLWKHEIRELYPDPVSFSTYLNNVQSCISVVATAISLFVSGNSLRLLGWTKTAMITPAILLITSVGFFGSLFLKDSPWLVESLVGYSPLVLVVFFGSLQNCCSRAAKYTVFDATKEMAFIPLSRENQVKGKAAIDGVCNRLGKTGGSIIYQCHLLFFSTLTASAPSISIILFFIIGLWFVAVRNLGKKFNALTATTLP